MFEIYAKKSSSETHNVRYLLAALLLSFLVLSSIHFIRSDLAPQTPIGTEAYHHINVAQQINDPGQSALKTYGTGLHGVNPYTITLAYFMRVIPPYHASLLLPLLCGLLSMLIGYVLLKRCRLSDQMSCVTLLILAISPPFIFTFSRSSIYALIIPLNLVTLLCITHSDKRVQYLSLFWALAIFMFGQIATLVALLFMLTYFHMATKNKIALSCLLITLGVLVVFALSPIGNAAELYAETTTKVGFTLSHMISDLGSDNGFGVFDVLLLFFGIVVSWKYKERHSSMYLLMLILYLAATHLNFDLTIYLYFAGAYFIGLGFAGILRREWNLQLVGELTVIIVICGLLFSSIAYVNRAVHEGPSTDYVEGLTALMSEDPGVTLSHHSRSLLISSIARKKPLLPKSEALVESPELRDSQAIFESRNIETTLNLLESHSIVYIVIDSEMKGSLIWQGKKQGLLFLVQNEDIFENIFKNDDVEIYKVRTYKINTY